jgi:hypothetical protein
MTGPDREIKSAVDALVYRLANRQPGTDDEPFAMEYVQALIGRGWRPTNARPAPVWQRPSGSGRPPTDEWRQARAELDARHEPRDAA